MPLQGDQRALLQLLCERGQSYEDISGLLEVSPDQVRERAREALSEIAGSDPDSEVALTDFLLGQADPIGRADAVRFLQADNEALELARTIQDGLREIAPDAKQPKLPEPRGKRARAALPDASEAAAEPPAPGDAGTGRGRDSGPSRQTKMIAALAVIGVILAVVILAVAGVFDGGDASTAATTSTGTTGSTDQRNITTVSLKPKAGSGVAGKAVFELVSDQQLNLNVDVQGLDPNLPTGRTYLVWLMVGDSAGYPIDRLEPDQNGGFSGSLTVPTPIAVAVGSQARAVRISSSSVSRLQSEIEKATKQKVPILPFVGAELASGEIPLVKGKRQGG